MEFGVGKHGHKTAPFIELLHKNHLARTVMPPDKRRDWKKHDVDCNERDKRTVKVSVDQCFSIFFLERNLTQMFTLLMEPYAMIQASILLSVINQMDRNVASMFYFYALAESLAATRGTLRFRGTTVEKRCDRQCRPELYTVSVWSPNAPLARNRNPEPGPSPPFSFEDRFCPKTKFTEWVKICATAGYW